MVAVQDTVKALVKKGLTRQEAIQEVERKLKGKLPPHIVDIINRDLDCQEYFKEELNNGRQI